MEIISALRPVLTYKELETVLDDFQGAGFKLNTGIKDGQGRVIWASLATPCGRSHFLLKREAGHQKEHAQGVVLYCCLPNDTSADKAYDHFVACGFPMVEELGDRYWGDRTFTFQDKGGYRWTIAQSIPGFDVTLPSGHTFMETKVPALV